MPAADPHRTDPEIAIFASNVSARLATYALSAVTVGVGLWVVLDDRLLAVVVAANVLLIGLVVLLLRRVSATERRVRSLEQGHKRLPSMLSAERRGTVEGVLAGMRHPELGVDQLVGDALSRALDADRAGRAGQIQDVQRIVAKLERDLGNMRQDALLLPGQLQADVWSTANLLRLVDVHEEMPSPGGFAATPNTLLGLVAEVLRHPGNRLLAVECGSGTSTVWLALAMRQRGSGRVVALEHDQGYARQTVLALQRAGLADWADVRLAPLVDLAADARTKSASAPEAASSRQGEDLVEVLRWYDPASVADLQDIDVLFVDGPPGHTGRGATLGARFPAMTVMSDKLRDGATVVLDDVARPQEAAAAARWLAKPAGRTRLEVVGDTDRARVFRASRDVGPLESVDDRARAVNPAG